MDALTSALNFIYDSCNADDNGLVESSVLIEALRKHYPGDEEDSIELKREFEAVMGARVCENISKSEFLKLMTAAAQEVASSDGDFKSKKIREISSNSKSSCDHSTSYLEIFEYNGSGHVDPISSESDCEQGLYFVKSSSVLSERTEKRLIKLMEVNAQLDNLVKSKDLVITKLREEIRDLKNCLSQAETEDSIVSSLRGKINELNVRIKCLNEDYAICQEKADKLDDMEDQIENLERLNDKLLNEYNEAREYHSILLDKISTQEEYCVGLKNKINELSTHLATEEILLSRIECLTEEKKVLQEQLDNSTALMSTHFIEVIGDDPSIEEPNQNSPVTTRFKGMSINQELALVQPDHLALMKPFHSNEARETRNKATSCDGFRQGIDSSTQTSTALMIVPTDAVCRGNNQLKKTSSKSTWTDDVALAYPFFVNRTTNTRRLLHLSGLSCKNMVVPVEGLPKCTTRRATNNYNYTFHINSEAKVNSQRRKSVSWTICIIALILSCVAILYQANIPIPLNNFEGGLELTLPRGLPPY